MSTITKMEAGRAVPEETKLLAEIRPKPALSRLLQCCVLPTKVVPIQDLTNIPITNKKRLIPTTDLIHLVHLQVVCLLI